MRLAEGDEERGYAHHGSQNISGGDGLRLIILNEYNDLLSPVAIFRSERNKNCQNTIMNISRNNHQITDTFKMSGFANEATIRTNSKITEVKMRGLVIIQSAFAIEGFSFNCS